MAGRPYPVAALTLLLALAGCSGKPADPAAAAVPALDTLIVATGAGAGGMSWDGVVQAVEQVQLSAQTAGRVAALAADVDQHVARGEVLLQLTGAEQGATVAAAQAQLRAAEAQLADARNRFQRANELVGRQLISRDDFDRVKSAHDSMQASRDGAAAQIVQAQQQLAYTVVRAPYAGIVAARHVELGETVAPGQPLYTIYAPGELRVAVQVPEGDAAAIRANPAATVLLPDGRQANAAKIIVYPGADPQAHSTTVRVVLPPLQAPPRPGQTIKVRFAAAAGPAGIWLPASAIVNRGELVGAYVVGESTVVLRQLRVGRSMDNRIEVIAGLVAGERVAADPVAALQALGAMRGKPAATRE
ncbi:MAG: efflux RND transporter periplasmic adaptor subunit [Steroidobacteraceae bacterium]